MVCISAWTENVTRLHGQSICEELAHVQHNTFFKFLNTAATLRTSCFVHAHLSCPYAVRSRAAAAAQYDKVNRDSGSCAPGAAIAVDDHCHSAGSAHAMITVLLGSPLRSAT